ncbi:TPR-like protein [Rhizoctonia solani]|uniref:TPR-like protein n=1 Tax=Rhizoctonia solani TaxID=456999 RepID=A0A8H7I6K0_9AGAM|nr:TPR-like protein [Rhizoctonia solani]
MDDDHPRMPFFLSALAAAHDMRYNLIGEKDDINKAIEWGFTSLLLTPDDSPSLPDLLDIAQSIEYTLAAVSLTSEVNPKLPALLADLGECYKKRFRRTGDPKDLNKSIEHESRGLALAPEGYPYLLLQLVKLGESYTDRKQFERLGEPNDLEKAIEYGSRALRLTPDGDRTLSRRLANLGVSYSVRYRRFGELIDLEKAIEHESRALALNPSSPGRLTNLGAFYYYRFQRLGNVDDLEKSIEYGSRALELTLNDHPELPSRLANLGLSYNHRHQRLGNLNDLEKAIEYGTRAVALTPDSEMKDLEKSIEYESRALALTPDDHPELANQLSNLAQSYSARFKRLKKLEDHKKAFEYGSRALALTLQDDPSLASRLSNIGLLYRDQFQLLGQQEDIDKSIAYQVRALALTPEGQQDLPSRLASLGLSHVLRFLSLRERDDIEKSIHRLLRSSYHSTGDASHLEEALKYYRLAIHSPGGTRAKKFTYAFMWAKLSSEYNSFDPIEAYQTTMDLLPQFIWLGATNNQRYSDLSSAAALAVHAASAAIASSKHALALEWLEHARCVVWNQSLMLRSPLEELHSAHPDLASRLRKVSYQLHSAASESQEFRALSTGTMTQEQIAQEHRRLASEYNDLVAQARMLPGFGDLLRPVKSKNLIRAARNGPVAVINCDDDRCDALMILPEHETIHHIALPNFNANKARHARSELVESLRDKGIRERGFRRLEEPGKRANFGNVLAILWNDVVKPILDWLGYTCNHAGEMPHITWCPTGALSFLPLHAAGDYNQPQSKTFDYVISSYAPTLTSLLSLTSSSLVPVLEFLGSAYSLPPAIIHCWNRWRAVISSNSYREHG